MIDNFLDVQVLDRKKGNESRICIISIIEEEMIEIVNCFQMKPIAGKYMYWEGNIEKYPNMVIHCYQQNESGNIFSTQLTRYVLEEDYDYYFCIGTAGAMNLKLYDVVFANQIIYLEKGANTSYGKEYDGKAPEISEKEKNIINTFLTLIKAKEEFPFSVTSGPIYSGENVEKNPQLEDLKRGKTFARHLAAIDMESYGVFQALRFYQGFEGGKDKFVFIIRGISDKADDLKNFIYDDGLGPDERKKCAMKNALNILGKFLTFLLEIKRNE